MAVVGDLGGNPITLENAAEEATLQRLVDLFENKFADNSGVKKKEAEAIKAATKETKSYQDIVDSTSKGMEKYEVKLTTFGERLGQTTDAIKNAGASLTNSFKALGEGGENMGGALGSLTGPVAGKLNALGIAGRMASTGLTGLSFVVGLALGAFDKSVKTFQQLTMAGATFGGDMIAMRTAAGSAGVTVATFADAVSKNVSGLADFGGTATQGALILSQVTKAGKSSSNELFRLGIAAKDQPEFFAQFISDLSTSGRSLNTFGGDFTRIAAVAVKYRKDLQALQEITGQSREEQEAALKAQKQDAAFQAILADMDVEQAKSLEGLMASMSPLEQQMLKQQMTIGSFTGETAAAASQMPGVAGRVMDVVNALNRGESDMAGAYARSSQQRAQELKRDAETAREYAKMSAFTNNILTKIGVENSIFLTKQQERNAEMEKNLATVRAQQATEQENTKLAAKRSEAMAQIQVAFENLGNKLIDTGIVEKLVEGLTFVADNIAGIANFLKEQSTGTLIAGGLTALFAGPAVLSAMTGGVGKVMSGIGTKLGGGITSMFGMAGGGGGGAGKAGGGMLAGLAKGMSAFGAGSVKILLGAATIAGVITAIGAGIAAAAWLTGKALPTLTNGLKGFEDLDGDRLVTAAKGLAAVSAAMAAMGAGSAVGAVGNAVGKAFNFLSGTDSNSMPEQMVELAGGVETFAKAIEKLDLAKMTALAGFVVPGAADLAMVVDKINDSKYRETGPAGGDSARVVDRINSARTEATATEATATTTASATAQTETTTALAAEANTAQQPMQNTSSEHTALLQRLLDVQTRQGTETNDLLRRISNDI
jgi:hypothetical protein